LNGSNNGFTCFGKSGTEVKLER